MSRKEYHRQYYQTNKERMDARNRLWQQTNKDKVYQYDVKRRYGLSREQFDTLSKVCEICGTDENLVVDHCHNSNVVRGRLYKPCNSALGLLKDSRWNLIAAIDYLDKQKWIVMEEVNSAGALRASRLKNKPKRS